MPVRKKSHSRKKRFKTQKAQNVRKRTRSKYIKKLRRKSILIGGLSIKEKIMAAREKIMAARKNKKEIWDAERETHRAKRKVRMVVGEPCSTATFNAKEIFQVKDKKKTDIYIQCQNAGEGKTWYKVDSNNVENRNGKFVLKNPAESGTYMVDGQPCLLKDFDSKTIGKSKVTGKDIFCQHTPDGTMWEEEKRDMVTGEPCPLKDIDNKTIGKSKDTGKDIFCQHTPDGKMWEEKKRYMVTGEPCPIKDFESQTMVESKDNGNIIFIQCKHTVDGKKWEGGRSHGFAPQDLVDSNSDTPYEDYEEFNLNNNDNNTSGDT